MNIPPSRLLPDAVDTLFLRACLHDGPRAHEAWDRWCAEATRGGTPLVRALVPVNGFLPLLAWNLQRTGAPLDQRLQTHFRSARLTEELRWRRYRGICEAAFRLLNEAEVPFIGLKGAVVSERVYPLPMLRHSDDIDVLLHERDLGRASEVLLRAGWRPRRAPVLKGVQHVPPLVHESDVPIELHWRLMIPYYTIPYDRLWARSQAVRIADVDIRALAETDSLLHALAHGMYGRPELKWAADAWFILAANPDLDWTTFTETAIAARLELPLYQALRFLSDRLDAPVPPRVLAALEPRAARTNFAGRSVARPWPAGGWRRAFPPPVQFALHYDVPLWTVPFYYVYRLARYQRGA